MKLTRVAYKIGLVSGPAATLLGTREINTVEIVRHSAGDSADFSNTAQRKVSNWLAHGFDAHYQRTPTHLWPITVAPSQIAYVIYELAEGESVGT